MKTHLLNITLKYKTGWLITQKKIIQHVVLNKNASDAAGSKLKKITLTII
jgi:hypothetical protein